MKLLFIELLKDLNNTFNGQLVNSNIEDYIDKIIDNATIIKIVENNILFALIAYYENDKKRESAYLTMLAVSNKYSNKGYGNILLKKATNNLIRKGFKYFELEVLKSNKKAVEFYKKNNFQIIESRGLKFYMKKYLKDVS